MALTATVRRFQIQLSDVDRGVYETLDVRVAQHPSESDRFMLTRLLAYCLCHDPQIAFASAGISNRDEPPVFVRDAYDKYLLWIEVGTPTAERLHKASKASMRVALFTSERPETIRRAYESKTIHQSEKIELWRLDAGLLTAIEPHLEKSNRWELVRNGGLLYVTIAGKVLEGALTMSEGISE